MIGSMNDYVSDLASLENLKEWHFEGVIYCKTQDPGNTDSSHCLWAPDVAQGTDGRTKAQALNYLGNIHGGLVCIHGQWYIFYHRQTNQTQFSRQACAEAVTMLPDGSFLRQR